MHCMHALQASSIALLFVAGALAALPARGQAIDKTAPGAVALSSEKLAKRLANPVAAMISVSFQLNHDQDIGSARSGKRWTLNIQPVIPIDLNADWNLISRTVLPVTWQDEIFPGAGSQSGLGDTLQSVFFSPKKPTAGGWIWSAGLVLLLPTSTNDLLSGNKWGAGPTGVGCARTGPGPTARWPTTFGLSPATAAAPASTRATCNSSFRAPRPPRTPSR